MAKPYLVIIETQTGPQPQIWYEDRGGFAGCAHLKPIEKHELPVTNPLRWTVDGALDHITKENRNV